MEECTRALGPSASRPRLVHSALRTPAERRRPFGVHCRQDEAPQETKVFQEMHSLLGSNGFIRLFPESVAGVRGGNERAHEDDEARRRNLPVAKRMPAMTCTPPLTRTTVSVSKAPRAVFRAPDQ